MTSTLPDTEEGLSLFGLPAGQENTTGRKIALPALPYSRLPALESLLSVALSSDWQPDSITRLFLCRKWSRFQN